MRLSRRTFLQQVGLTLAAWGASETMLCKLCDRYQQALASPTNRKLALLVGINQYTNSINAGLEGCVTDVELQRELLIHRFGFQPTDILTLTDWQATRDAVETAFMEHLIQQVRSDDVVVVHFSTLGSTVAGGTGQSLRTSLVMADATPSGETPIVNDLLIETLGLLLRSLNTDRVTTILDTSFFYTGRPLQGNLRIRSYPNPSTAQPSEAELAFQESLLSQFGLARLPTQSDIATLRGLALTAATLDQVAMEVHWNRFSAGLFTSALTQSLWQSAPATRLLVTFQQATRQVERLAHQQHPEISGTQALTISQNKNLIPYFLPAAGLPMLTTESDGAIAAIEDSGTVRLWLGGIPAPLLDQYGIHSLLTTLPRSIADPTPPIRLQVVSWDGFDAQAKVSYQPDATAMTSLLQVGQQVREAVRVLPCNISLAVALDANLERIERVDAISAFTSVSRVSLAIAGEQAADYLFSKVQAQPTQLASLSAADVNGTTPVTYGLFTPGRDMILNTTGKGGEAVKVAVRRLIPKLKSLLAIKLLHLTVNSQTSQLPIVAQLEQLSPQEQVLVRQETNRTESSFAVQPKRLIDPLLTTVKIPGGSRVRYRVENAGTQPIYPLAIALDNSDDLQWLHLPTVDIDPIAQETAFNGAILPNTVAYLPDEVAGSGWQIQGSPKQTLMFLLFSRTPFQQTWTTIANQQRAGNSVKGGATIVNPLDVVQAIFQDLNQTTELAASINASDAYALDVSAWATFRFTYQIV